MTKVSIASLPSASSSLSAAPVVASPLYKANTRRVACRKCGCDVPERDLPRTRPGNERGSSRQVAIRVPHDVLDAVDAFASQAGLSRAGAMVLLARQGLGLEVPE